MTITDTDLTAMVKNIVAAVQPEQVILFGSLARYEAFDDFGGAIDRQATTALVAEFLQHVNQRLKTVH
ncbi:MAG: hypothetical protein H7837_00790 [Magnetococcus sp. MYC-9]